MIGKSWNEETLKEAFPTLKADLPLEPGAPGGMIKFRRSLTVSFFYKFYLHVLEMIGKGETIPEATRSATVEFARPLSRAQQV